MKNKQRKDFVRRQNINRNVPTIEVEEEVNVYKNVGVRPDGTAKKEHVGYKTKIKKVKQYRNHVKGDRSKPLYDNEDRNIGMIEYPTPKRFIVNDPRGRLQRLTIREAKRRGIDPKNITLQQTEEIAELVLSRTPHLKNKLQTT